MSATVGQFSEAVALGMRQSDFAIDLVPREPGSTFGVKYTISLTSTAAGPVTSSQFYGVTQVIFLDGVTFAYDNHPAVQNISPTLTGVAIDTSQLNNFARIAAGSGVVSGFQNDNTFFVEAGSKEIYSGNGDDKVLVKHIVGERRVDIFDRSGRGSDLWRNWPRNGLGRLKSRCDLRKRGQ